MSAFLAQFHLLHPSWLIALLPLPWLCWMQWRRQRGRAELARLADADMLPLLLAEGSRGRRHGLVLLALGWLLAVFALCGPAWERLPMPLTAAGHARVIALSLSSDMLAADVAPDRLTRARYKVRDLLEANRAGQNALVAYAGAAFVVAPLTSDADTVLNLLDSLSPDVMPVDGDDASQAIDMGIKLLQQAGVHGGDIVLVASDADKSAVDAAQRARQADVRVSVLAVGTDTGAPVSLAEGGFLKDAQGNIVVARLDEPRLRSIADAGGGAYRALSADGSDVTALAVHGAAHEQAATDAHEIHSDEWRDRGPWLLLALLPLAALAFRRGWLAVLALVVLLPIMPAKAGGWPDLWRNRNQRAAVALAQGQPKQAMQLARDPGLRGAAAYREGDYATAAGDFGNVGGADAAYNLGNALAKAGKYPEAIDSYDRALKLAPGMDDARANRKAVEDWMKRQQKKQRQQGDKQKNQQNNGGQQQKGQSPSSSSSAQEQGKQGQNNASSDDNKTQQGGKPNNNEQRNGDAGDDRTQPRSGDRAEAARQKQQQAQAQAAVKQTMDKQLQGQRKPASHMLGTPRDEPGAHLPQAMRQELQRVPDDPGGLLRRKFLLEYQQRQQGSGGQP